MNMSDMKAMITGSYYSRTKSSKKQNVKSKNTQKNGVITVKRKFNASKTLAQLANAKSKSQVGAIERTVRAQMQAMKKQSGSNEAIRQMKKVLQKTDRKRNALTKEEQLDNNRKIAKSANHKNQEAKFANELGRKRLNRMRRERVDALNSVDVYDENKRDTYSLQGQDEGQATSIDMTCDSFDVSAGVSGSEFGIAIDALL